MKPEEPAKGKGQNPPDSKATKQLSPIWVVLLMGTFLASVVLFVLGIAVTTVNIFRGGHAFSMISFGSIGGVLVRVFSPERFTQGGKGWLVAVVLGMSGFIVGLLTVHHLPLELVPITSPVLAFLVGLAVTLYGAEHVCELLDGLSGRE